jgi:hypothetical protein
MTEASVGQPGNDCSRIVMRRRRSVRSAARSFADRARGLCLEFVIARDHRALVRRAEKLGTGLRNFGQMP